MHYPFSLQLFIILFITINSSSGKNRLNKNHFPKDFLFGVASAAYQIEGAWNEDGKGENIWDNFVHTKPERIAGNATGNVACDSYHRTSEDIEMIRNLGVNFYRFSISWSRVLPTGLTHKLNPKGIEYYNRLLDGLISAGITPMVTMYHWDLPQRLQDLGGWTNPLLADYFEDFARVMYENFGDRVKYWITFNEPANTCLQGYGSDLKAPGIDWRGVGEYLCAHTIIRAHAKAFHLYRNTYQQKYKGKVGITVDAPWAEPVNEKNENKEASERFLQFMIGWFANPIFKGDYPDVMKTLIRANSLAEGFNRSRLPEFDDKEKRSILGTYDFFAFNTYTTILVGNNNATFHPELGPMYFKDIGIDFSVDEKWSTSASFWLKVVPWGFNKLLKWIQKSYGDVEIYVTENGYSDEKNTLEDFDRINYYKEYLSALLDAIDDGVNVKAYTFWTLMDNFEWTEGYEHAFGLYHVNFSHPDLPRLPKKSVEFVKNLITQRRLSEDNYFSIKEEL